MPNLRHLRFDGYMRPNTLGALANNLPRLQSIRLSRIVSYGVMSRVIRGRGLGSNLEDGISGDGLTGRVL